MDFTPNDILLNETYPALPYRRRRFEEKVIHKWGQLKLLMTEVQFFTKFWNPKQVPNPIVVYAGAASGIHIPYLSELFPTFTFELYDPARFDIEPTEKIHIYNEYFTDAVAQKYAGRNDIFFLSDIRTVDKDVAEDETIEKEILKDMCMQQDWYEIIQPVKAHLKFRLPYSSVDQDLNVEYLYGYLFWQPWTGPTSTELRLVPVGNEKVRWDGLRYEQQCFFHNVVVRNQYTYKNPFTDDSTPIYSNQLLNDYDSRLTTQIIIEYLSTFSILTYDNFVEWVNRAMRALDWNHSGKTIADIRDAPITQFAVDSPILQEVYQEWIRKQRLVNVLIQYRTPEWTNFEEEVSGLWFDISMSQNTKERNEAISNWVSLWTSQKKLVNPSLGAIIDSIEQPVVIKKDKYAKAKLIFPSSKEMKIQYRTIQTGSLPSYFYYEASDKKVPKDVITATYLRYLLLDNTFWSFTLSDKTREALSNYGFTDMIYVSPFQKYENNYYIYDQDRVYNKRVSGWYESQLVLESGNYWVNVPPTYYIQDFIDRFTYLLRGEIAYSFGFIVPEQMVGGFPEKWIQVKKRVDRVLGCDAFKKLPTRLGKMYIVIMSNIPGFVNKEDALQFHKYFM